MPVPDSGIPLPAAAIHDLAGLFKQPPTRSTTVGFAEGSTILVTGRPGSGKSFFALSLAREHLLAYQRAHPSQAARLIFVGVGATRERLASQYAAFGWFGSEGTNRDPIDCAIVAVDETTLPQPASGADELITPLLTRLRRTAMAAAGVVNPAVFVVFDSLTSLVKGSATSGERQRYLQELVTLTKKYLGDSKKMCVLTADAADSPDDGIRPEREAAADFVFHLGFRDTGGGRTARVLDVRKCPEHTPMLIGRHSWEVLHPGNIEEVIAPWELQDMVRACQPAGKWGVVYVSPHIRLPDIGGDLQDAGFPKPDKNRLVVVRPDRAISCGVPGLDEMLAGDQDYWSKPTRALLEDPIPYPTGRGLYPGSVTFLIGRPGTGKSNSCLQFLLAAETSRTTDTITRCLYVNFENLFNQVLDWFPGPDDQRKRLWLCHRLYRRRTQFDFAHFVHELYFLIQKHEIVRVAFDGLTDLARADDPQEFEFFLEELIVLVRKAKQDHRHHLRADRKRLHRELARVTDEDDRRSVRENIAAIKKKLRGHWEITIVISLETDPDSPEAARFEQKNSPADNVVVFRQVKINDERRKTVEVRKARGRAPDRQVRELLIRPKSPFPLRVVPGLDNYRNVTDGQPEPVRVALQLVGENRAAVRANIRLTDRLDDLFGYPITAYEFIRGEIARTLRDIASGTDRIPTWDVKLFHVDEWWVRELRVIALRPPDRLLAETRHSLLRLNAFLAADPVRESGKPGKPPSHDALPSDFWAVEMEKACVPVVTPGEEGRTLIRADVIALPAYADYGLFCLNMTPGEEGHDRTWRAVLDAAPRVWAADALVDGHQWFAAPIDGGQTAVNAMLARGVTPHAWENSSAEATAIGFAFDMATPATAGCTFLELCWAFGAGEDFLIRDVERYRTRASLTFHPAVRAISLLMFLVAEGLMPPRTTLPDTKRAVFSRHWYSSLVDVDDVVAPKDQADPAPAAVAPADKSARGSGSIKWSPVRPEPEPIRKARVAKLNLCPVPFFPLGPASPETRTRICVHDAVVRFGRLLKRTAAAVAYRAGLKAVEPSVLPEVDKADEPSVFPEADVAAVRDRLASARTTFEEAFPNGDPKWRNLDEWENYQPWLENDAEPLADGSGSVQRVVAALRKAGGIVRDAVLTSPLFGCGRGYEDHRPVQADGFDPKYPKSSPPNGPTHWFHLPYAMFMDVRDVLEMLRWHDHRLDALAAGERGRLGSVVLGPLTDGSTEEVGEAAMSGFSCEGSWLVGADRTTRSPNLSAKILNEMTSLESGEERARLGAGIPVRKDFYEYHGRTPFPYAPDPELTWNRFLIAVGSRSRRRSRSFCARVRVSVAFAEIDRLVFDCLTRADVRRKDYTAKREAIVGELVGAATDAVHALFEWVRQEMRAQCKLDEDAHRAAGGTKLARPECVTCPNREKCKGLLEASP